MLGAAHLALQVDNIAAMFERMYASGAKIGHRGLGSSQPVAGRAGIGPRTARPHLETTPSVEPGDTAAPGANLGNIYGRDA